VRKTPSQKKAKITKTSTKLTTKLTKTKAKEMRPLSPNVHEDLLKT
jgi:hypothetical protein